jgi:hypothetical protein
MKEKAKQYKYFIFTALLLAFFVLPLMGFAAGTGEALNGLRTTADKGFNNKVNDGSADVTGIITDLPTSIGQVVGAVLAFIGVIFLILMIYAGFTWMMARGNQQDVQKAKDMIEAAIIGLIIVMAAYAITAYIGNILTTPAS